MKRDKGAFPRYLEAHFPEGVRQALVECMQKGGFAPEQWMQRVVSGESVWETAQGVVSKAYNQGRQDGPGIQGIEAAIRSYWLAYKKGELSGGVSPETPPITEGSNDQGTGVQRGISGEAHRTSSSLQAVPVGGDARGGDA